MSDAGTIYRHFISKFPTPKSGDLRIWWIPQILGSPFDPPVFEWPVKDLDQASMMLDALAAYDDFQFAEGIKGDYSNTGGLLIFDGESWEYWEDDEGDDFDTWRNTQESDPS